MNDKKADNPYAKTKKKPKPQEPDSDFLPDSGWIICYSFYKCIN